MLRYYNYLGVRRQIQPQSGLGVRTGSGIQMSRQRRHTKTVPSSPLEGGYLGFRPLAGAMSQVRSGRGCLGGLGFRGLGGSRRLGGRGIASIQQRGRRIRPACGAASSRAIISGWESWCCSWLPKQAASYGTNRISHPNFRGSNPSGWRGGVGSGVGSPGSASPGGGGPPGAGGPPGGGSRRGRTVRGRGGRSLPASARAASFVNRARRWRSRATVRRMSGPAVRSAAIRLATEAHSPPMMRPNVRLRLSGAGAVCTTALCDYIPCLSRKSVGKVAGKQRILKEHHGAARAQKRPARSGTHRVGGRAHPVEPG
jgi:hypothetical protein